MSPTPIGNIDALSPAGPWEGLETWRGRWPGTGDIVEVRVHPLGTPGAERAWRTEVRALAALRHDGVERIHDWGGPDGAGSGAWVERPIAGWVCVDGLPEGLPDRPPGDWDTTRRLCRALLVALAHAHARGVIHRRVRPARVRLDVAGQPRLAGFDGALLAFVEEPPTELPPEPWAAPEVAEGRWRDQGPWSDFYGVGAIAAWAWAGRGPPEARLARGRWQEPTPPTPRWSAPDGLWDWILRLTHPTPGERPRHAADAIDALDTLAGPGPRRRRAPALARTPRPPGDLPGAGAGLLGLRPAPLVGRDAETRGLWRAARGVARGKGAGVVLVRGPRGVGVSRLVGWTAERVAEAGLGPVWRVRGGDDARLGRTTARALGLAGLAPDRVQARLRWLLRDAVDDADVASLGAFLSGTPPPSPPDAALARLLTAQAAGAACAVLAVVDATGSPVLLALALRLLRGPAPILLVLGAGEEDLVERPADRAALEALAAAPGGRQQVVGPVADAVQLVRAWLPVDLALARQIADRAGGHPLFTAQLLGALVARHGLSWDGRAWSLRDGVSLQPPPDLLEAAGAHLDAVLSGRGPGAASALELAAVLGDPVDPAEWAAACGRAALPPLGDLVETLRDRGLAHVENDGGWRFSHAPLREVLRERAARAGRLAEWHLLAAEALRPLPGRPDLDARRGRHLLAADRPDAAAASFRDALHEALAGGDLRLVQEVLPAWATAVSRAEPADAERWRVEGLLVEAEVALARHAYREGGGLATEAEAGAAALGWVEGQARALRASALAARRTGDLAGAEAGLRQSLRLAAGVAAPGVRAAAAEALGTVLFRTGRLPGAVVWWRKAERWYADGGDAAGRAGCELALAQAAFQLGRDGLAARHARIARGWARRARRGRLLPEATVVLADVARARGDLAEAARGYRAARRAFLALGSGDLLVVDGKLALVRMDRGRHAEARRGLGACLAAAEAQGRRHLAIRLLVALLPTYAAAADWDAWDGAVVRIAAGRTALALADRDVARVGRLAAQGARAAGDEARAARIEALLTY